MSSLGFLCVFPKYILQEELFVCNRFNFWTYGQCFVISWRMQKCQMVADGSLLHKCSQWSSPLKIFVAISIATAYIPQMIMWHLTILHLYSQQRCYYCFKCKAIIHLVSLSSLSIISIVSFSSGLSGYNTSFKLL